MSLESGKTLGGVGAILIAIGSVFPFLSLVGIILVLVAMRRLADYYEEQGIFDNALWGFIFGIIGIVGAIIVFILLIFTGAIWSVTTGFPFASSAVIGGIIVAIIVWFVFSLLQAIYYRRAFTILSEKSEEKMFDSAGLLLLIGAILTIILIGALVSLVAWILVAVGFFSIKTLPTPLPPLAVPQAPTAPTEKIYCQYCGTENKSDAVFCKKCGKKMAEE
ncbi:MAG: DUF996 domain-containing protein [Candidatus Bathyarchaeota archaeon]|nr:DUF996 domain-containing protein [Candidatus Bathyarchaeota archaeon]